MNQPTDFPDLATRMTDVGSLRPEDAVQCLQSAAPHLAAQIERDGKRQGPLSFWGPCRNLDEFTETRIVEPEILDVISRLSGHQLSHNLPHAGLQHTYGYLFSTISTPWGYKRDRWLETGLESGFGLDSQTLSPTPEAGTLLSNATWLAGQIAFRRNRDARAKLNRYLRNKVSPDLLTNPIGKDQIQLTEKIHSAHRGRRRAWTLQTDIVPYPNDSSTHLLVYSTIDHTRMTHLLTTMFPIQAAMAAEVGERANTRRRDDIRPRYNCHIPGLASGFHSGTCRLKTL